MSNRWHSVREPLLNELWEQYQERMADAEMEVIVMIDGASIPTAVCYDGDGFYSGVDPVPVTAWRPFPPAPGKELQLVDAALLIEKSKDFFKDLIDAGEMNVDVFDFNVRFQKMLGAVIEETEKRA